MKGNGNDHINVMKQAATRLFKELGEISGVFQFILMFKTNDHIAAIIIITYRRNGLIKGVFFFLTRAATVFANGRKIKPHFCAKRKATTTTHGFRYKMKIFPAIWTNIMSLI